MSRFPHEFWQNVFKPSPTTCDKTFSRHSQRQICTCNRAKCNGHLSLQTGVKYKPTGARNLSDSSTAFDEINQGTGLIIDLSLQNNSGGTIGA